MKKYLLIIVLIAAAVGLSGFRPHSGEMMSNTYKLSETNACYTVTGVVDQTAQPDGSFVGPASGDLEGTVSTAAGPIEIHGIVIFRDAVQTWKITGGSVAELIGKTLVFETKFRGIITDYPMMKINSTGTLIEGAEMGSITFHGWALIGAPLVNHWEYHAVVCP